MSRCELDRACGE